MEMLKKLFSLEGKVVVITGGAQGIGKAVAEHIAAVGGEIVIIDQQVEKAEETAFEIGQKYQRKTFAVGADVTKPEEVALAIEKADREMGKLDLLFNNAGIVLQKPVVELNPEEWRKVIDVNLNGIFFVAQAFGRYLIERNKDGAIVNTASMSGTIVNYPQQQASYNASKAGVVQLTKSLAVEWADKGIRVNSISPGYIFTELTSFVREDWRALWKELTPFKRMGKPEELAGAVIYLLSESASFATGTDLIIDGGFTIV
ncbi:SDR family oxidoreductase [Pullulanibacillus sp. KACC 23026]|uniref:glucose 1-dehydrogenase n=1 Tax=Pullulanibacillus sp. KACC 23026 TaxID=3028315 RepID=UPI0023AFE93D|nr:glucose 1-dehydrogenase [Pullulanibacillus sp. KACC 23026]WEG13355.1 SDR family oxidoreductase [Pullulanibacillus sp. KACC 23026]